MQPACALSGRAAAPVRVSSPFAPHPVAGRVARAPLAPPAAVQNPLAALFQPKQAAPKTSATTAALVDEILELAASTKAGVKTPTAKADRIAELAAQLKATRGRAPTTRSPFFNGVYSVSYCSNPAAPGGPVLTSGLGRVVAAGQQPQQILEPGRLTNRVSFKALGFLPNTAQQSAQLEITGPHTYRVTFPKSERNNVRDFEVLFLNEDVRVAEYQPADGRPAQLFVFERLGGLDEEEEEEEEEEVAPPLPRQQRGRQAPAAPAPAPAPSRPAEKAPAFSLASFFAKPRAVESLATIVERESAAADRRTGMVDAPPPPSAPAAKRAPPPPSRPAPKQQQKTAPAVAAAPAQMLTILRRPGSAPKQAAAPQAQTPRPDPAAAAREAVARFADAAKAAAADVREATAAARAASAEAAPVLRQTAGPRAAVGRAAAVAEATEAEFEEAAAALAEAEAEVKRAAEALRFLEKQRV